MMTQSKQIIVRLGVMLLLLLVLALGQVVSAENSDEQTTSHEAHTQLFTKDNIGCYPVTPEGLSSVTIQSLTIPSTETTTTLLVSFEYLGEQVVWRGVGEFQFDPNLLSINGIQTPEFPGAVGYGVYDNMVGTFEIGFDATSYGGYPPTTVAISLTVNTTGIVQVGSTQIMGSAVGMKECLLNYEGLVGGYSGYSYGGPSSFHYAKGLADIVVEPTSNTVSVFDTTQTPLTVGVSATAVNLTTHHSVILAVLVVVIATSFVLLNHSSTFRRHLDD